MHVVFLGYEDSPLIDFLESTGNIVTQTMDRVSLTDLDTMKPDLLVSYGYTHILPKTITDAYAGRAVNLHISYLPWNRGSDPNFWSFIDDTPKGVTLHHLDEGVDTGHIIEQRELRFTQSDETLKTSYAALRSAAERLFRDMWSSLRSDTAPRRPQQGSGSYHRARDKEPLLYLLTDGWDTPVRVLTDYGKSLRGATETKRTMWSRLRARG